MVEPPPSEGGEATITAMSALAGVGQYMSTNSAKSTFLRNIGLVVKARSSKLPHDQDMQAQSNFVSHQNKLQLYNKRKVGIKLNSLADKCTTRSSEA